MLHKDLASQISPAGQIAHNLVAGGAKDNVEKEGAAFSRKGFSSGVLQVAWRATCADTKLLKLTVKRYQSADGSNWDAAETLVDAQTVFTAAAPTLTGSGVLEVAQNFGGLKEYLKYSVTADLNAADTDIAEYGMLVNRGGAVELPC